MNQFGHNFRLAIWGESHGHQIGISLDGVPAGIPLSEEDFAEDLARRRSGAPGTTPRREPDVPQIVSGVYDGYTTGAPLTIEFANTNTHSQDYSTVMRHYRPSHADLVAYHKFAGFNDPRGGGHFSARLTVALVAAADGVSVIRGTSRLEYKECNRSEAIREEYAKLGIEVDTSEEDLMKIRGGKVRAARTQSHGDHRMAMSLAVAALRADGEITIEGAESVAKSYPGFFEDLEHIRY